MAYANTPEYREYSQLLALYQSDPDLYPRPDPPPGQPGNDPGKGWQFDANVGVEYKPSDPLRISLDYTKSQLTRHDNGEVAFDTNIFTLHTPINFLVLYTCVPAGIRLAQIECRRAAPFRVEPESGHRLLCRV